MSEPREFSTLYTTESIGKQKSDRPTTNQYNCPICEDTGVLVQADGSVKPCKCWLQRQKQQRRLTANIPGRFTELSFDNFDLAFYPANQLSESFAATGKSHQQLAKDALAAAHKFVEQVTTAADLSTVRGLLFQGTIGSGKTHLAVAIANALLRRNQEVIFLVVPDFLDELRSSYGSYGEFDEVRLMNRAKNAPVLVLDDLGIHNFSDWTKNKLFSLINYRLNNGLPSIITTNLSMSELQDILGARIISRLIASCSICLLTNSKDIRMIKAKEGGSK